MKSRPMSIIVYGLAALFLLWLPGQVAAESNWWESKQEKSTTDQISVDDTVYQGKAQSASRTKEKTGHHPVESDQGIKRDRLPLSD